jgi:hypothetical protein
MVDFLAWFRPASPRPAFDAAAGQPAVQLSDRRKLAVILHSALEVALDHGMFGVWRNVSEVRRAREEIATLRERFGGAGKFQPQAINDLDDKYMRPLLFHLERSVIPRLYTDKKGVSFIKINDRIAKFAVLGLRTPDGGAETIRDILAKPFDDNDQQDPAWIGYVLHPGAENGLTGAQSLKAFAEIGALMLANVKQFRLGNHEQAVLQEAVRAADTFAPDAALPDAARRDIDDFGRQMAAGNIFFTRQGYAKMKTVVDFDANTYPEALVNLPDAELC